MRRYDTHYSLAANTNSRQTNIQPARFLFEVDPAVFLQRGVNHLAKAFDEGANFGVQPAGIRVEQDNRSKAA